jgi:hypothetical protein
VSGGEPAGSGRRRLPSRVGDLLPEAARRLGLESELRWARAVATWEAVVEELLPEAGGGSRPLRVEGATLVVEAAAPIVGQEIRLRADELAAAFTAAPGGIPVEGLRVVMGRGMIR